MTQDLEMKDRSTPSNSISPPVPSTLQRKYLRLPISNLCKFTSTIFLFLFIILLTWELWFTDLKEIASLIETGSYSKEVRRIARAVRLTIALRKKLTASVISSFLDHVLTPGSEPHAKLSAYLPKVNFCNETYMLDLVFRECSYL
jgi:26S proteasome regulatory subunit N3